MAKKARQANLEESVWDIFSIYQKMYNLSSLNVAVEWFVRDTIHGVNVAEKIAEYQNGNLKVNQLQPQIKESKPIVKDLTKNTKKEIISEKKKIEPNIDMAKTLLGNFSK